MFKTIAKRRRLGSRSRRARTQQQRNHSRRLSLENLEPRLALSGTWTALTHAAPAGIGTMELLTRWHGDRDPGQELVQTHAGRHRQLRQRHLVDDGQYEPGAFVRCHECAAGRPRVRLGGRVLRSDSLTANWTNTGEIYNPVTNTWSSIPNFPADEFRRRSHRCCCPMAGCWWAA